MQTVAATFCTGTSWSAVMSTQPDSKGTWASKYRSGSFNFSMASASALALSAASRSAFALASASAAALAAALRAAASLASSSAFNLAASASAALRASSSSLARLASSWARLAASSSALTLSSASFLAASSSSRCLASSSASFLSSSSASVVSSGNNISWHQRKTNTAGPPSAFEPIMVLCAVSTSEYLSGTSAFSSSLALKYSSTTKVTTSGAWRNAFCRASKSAILGRAPPSLSVFVTSFTLGTFGGEGRACAFNSKCAAS
mmetsp:Transcript_53584/g.149041  ORF Transcript_53584/g.149041 Transcript_53584/m.149041 type:complete len:262 (-) Transcript_53584:672-1457(-)